MAEKNELPEPDGKSEYPSDLLDPKVKAEKNYSLQMCKAVYNKHHLDVGYFSNSRRFDYIENRSYAKGNQAVSKYTKYFSHLKGDRGEDVTYMNLDYRIVPVIPKFMDVVLATAAKIDLDIFVDSINPKASQEKKNYKHNLWAKAVLKPFWEEQAAKAQMPELADQGNDYIPETKEELEMWMNLGFRLPEETAMELLVATVMNENDWGEDSHLVREDLFVNGVAFGSEYIDPISKKIKMQYEDPVNGIFQNFRGRNGTKEMSRIGVIRRMTISQLKLSAGNSLTEEQYYEVAKRFQGYYGNPSFISPLADYINTDAENRYMEYDTWEVLVMDLEWDTSDRIKIETREYASGEVVKNRVPFKTPLAKEEAVAGDSDEYTYLKTVKAVDRKAIYGAKWIIGTDYIYDYGKQKNIARRCENNKDPQKRFKFYRIATKSMLERMCGYADSIQIAWLKIQNLKARAMPKGLIIDTSAFDNVMLDNKAVSQKQLLEMAVQTGIILIRSETNTDEDQNPRVGKPIEETVGGIGVEFQELNNSILQDMQSLRDITGINSAMDASTLDPNSLVGNNKIALAGAANAIFPILNGFVKFSEQMASGIISHGMLLAKHGHLRDGYESSIGTEMCEALEIAAEDDENPPMMGLRVEGRPSQEVKQRLLKMVNDSLMSPMDPAKGGIELPDALELDRLIENGTQPKLIEAILRYRITESKKKLDASAQANSQAQAQQIQAQTQAAQQGELQQLQAKNDIAKDFYQFKTDQDIRKAEALHPYKIDEKMTDNMLNKDEAEHAAAVEQTQGK